MKIGKAAGYTGACVLCVMIAFTVINFCGCEEATGLDGLNVTPSSVVLTTASNSVKFTASGGSSNDLALPLEWNVSDTDLGSIDWSSGYDAGYKRNSATGDNLVIVHDQYGNEGFARVQQVGPARLTVIPPFVQMGTASNSVVFTVSGGSSNELAPWFEWSVSDSTLGYIAWSSGYEAGYFRHSPTGDNVITVRDQFGNEGSAKVRQTQGGQSLNLAKSQADAKTWTVSIVAPSGGPYQWWVATPSIGSISSVGNGPSAVYVVKIKGATNDVFVRDAARNIGAIPVP